MPRGNGVEILIVWALLLLVTWPGDRLVEQFVATLPTKSLLRASDTLIHGIIGALSWQLVCVINPQLYFNVTSTWYFTQNGREKQAFLSFASIYNMCIAFALASIVDLDHIIIDIIHMIQGGELISWQRGWFHFVVPPLLFTVVMYISCMAFRHLFYAKIGTIVLICIIGHDIRDALHHGLWLQPFAVTPRFPFWLYVCLTMLFPFITSGIDSIMLKRVVSSRFVSSISLV